MSITTQTVSVPSEVRHILASLRAGQRPIAPVCSIMQNQRTIADLPALVETHLKRPAFYDAHPNSSFSPLPPAFQLSKAHRKDQQLAGQQAELAHLLEPGYKSPRPETDADSASIAGPSRLSTNRTAGGFAAKAKSKAASGLGIRTQGNAGPQSSGPQSANGIYIDAKGKMHDTEFDPFAGVSELNRRKSRRRSAFGADHHKGSDSDSSSASGSDVGKDDGRKSIDAGEEDARKKLDERRRQEEAARLQAARRRSMASDRQSGRGTPSIRSSDESLHTGTSSHFERRLRTQQGYYIPSPLSPTFNPPNSGSSLANRTLATTAEEDSPEKTTEITDSTDLRAAENGDKPGPEDQRRAKVISPAPPSVISRTSGTSKTKKAKPPTVSVSKHDKKITVTGFDAPMSARSTASRPETPQDLVNHFDNLRVPGSARSVSSRRSSESTRSRPKPPAPPPEDLYPLTPAQIKQRQDQERRSGRSSALGSRSVSAYDRGLATPSRARVLPEIEIVEDDDPRIVFPEHGKTTRVQSIHEHDHVIRSPFAMSMSGHGSPGGSLHAPGSTTGRHVSGSHSIRSGLGTIGGSKPPSTIIEEGQGGYLPSRWASGDHNLRVTEDEKEKYRPREWGGKTGGLGGRPEEWQ